jgi:hypothetical protein
VNYARFGGDCSNGFKVGFSAVLQNYAASFKNWNTGSDKTSDPRSPVLKVDDRICTLKAPPKESPSCAPPKIG